MNENNQEPLLEVVGLNTHFFLEEGVVKAVDGVNLTIRRGQTVGIVGESGCGKSVTARSILGIVPSPGKTVSGEVIFYDEETAPNGESKQPVNLLELDPKGKEIRRIRGKKISMIFQEPMTSLSPVHKIGSQIIETIILHQKLSKAQAREQAAEILGRVGLSQPFELLNRYPHELSGGMRQRVMIAMALSCHPSLLIADEPTTALDVTTEAQILRLMRSLQAELGMAIMYITHNLGVVAQMTDYVIVMYLGKVVEETDVDTLFFDPKHPYTKALLRSIPRLGASQGQPLEVIHGSVPDPYNKPSGCPFHPRCPERIEGVCNTQVPEVIEVKPGHRVRCHLYV